MMRWWQCVAFLLAAANVCFAADQPKPEELTKMYNDTLAQLRAAQDRKNELATDNDHLTARLADLEKQVKATQDQLEGLKREQARYSERTFDLQSRDAAWEAFIAHDPELKARWNVFLEHDFLTASPDLPDAIEPLAVEPALDPPDATAAGFASSAGHGSARTMGLPSTRPARPGSVGAASASVHTDSRVPSKSALELAPLAPVAGSAGTSARSERSPAASSPASGMPIAASAIATSPAK